MDEQYPIERHSNESCDDYASSTSAKTIKILEKNHQTRDHLDALERRMDNWIAGNLKDLLHEAETIQECIKFKKKSTIAEVSKSFKQRVMKGKNNAAIKILSENMQNGVL